MRPTLALSLSLCAALAAGCGTNACKKNTVLVTVDFGASATAEMVLVSASLDGGAVVSGTVELDFASYPAGHSLTVSVSALSGTSILATNSVTVTLAQSCTSVPLSL